MSLLGGSHRMGKPISRDTLAIVALALIAGPLNIINLTVSGYANTYYAMAAQAASQSWSALFFGALDAQGFITTDKPPLATALMGLSVKTFGLSSWSIQRRTEKNRVVGMRTRPSGRSGGRWRCLGGLCAPDHRRAAS